MNIAINKTKMMKAVKDRLLQPLVVQCFGYRCLAYRDQKGRLRNFWNQKLVPLPAHLLDPED